MQSQNARPPFNFNRRLQLGLCGLLVGLLPLGFIAISSFLSVSTERERLTEADAQALTIANDLRYEQSNEDNLALRFTLSGDPALYKAIKKSQAAVMERLTRLERLDSRLSTRLQIQRIRELKGRLVRAAEPGLFMRKNGASVTRIHQYLEKHCKVYDLEVKSALSRLFRSELKNFGVASRRVDQSTQGLLRSLFIVATLTGTGFLLIVVLLMRLAQGKKRHETVQEQLYDQVRKTAQARKEVLEAVSHDLKNPLTAIELCLQLLQKQTSIESRPIVSAFGAVRAMRDLVQSLLDQAKMEAGAFELNLQLGSLSAVINETKKMLEPLAQEKSVQIVVAIEDRLPELQFDHRRMSQAIANILGNAIKFSPVGGLVTIQASFAEKGFRIRISDTGPGIPKEQLGQVFERFWQARGSKRMGTGLGLSIAKAVIDAHGGRIWVTSESGKGCEFQFLLPENLAWKARAA